MTINAIAKKSAMWNPWHGCRKLSAGCANCYVYRGDKRRGVDSSVVVRTSLFDLPLRRKRNGDYRISSGTLVYTCFTSDFLLDKADQWRDDAWSIIRHRSDLNFLFITKRIDRLADCFPHDWGDGWEHVTICCTIENQEMADLRLPIYRHLPVRHKVLICEPLLTAIDLSIYDIGQWVEQVVVGGESGTNARQCNFDWIIQLRDLCAQSGVAFWFKQTGSKFVKNGVLYNIARHLQHSQARRAGLNIESIYMTENNRDTNAPIWKEVEINFPI